MIIVAKPQPCMPLIVHFDNEVPVVAVAVQQMFSTIPSQRTLQSGTEIVELVLFRRTRGRVQLVLRGVLAGRFIDIQSATKLLPTSRIDIQVLQVLGGLRRKECRDSSNFFFGKRRQTV